MKTKYLWVIRTKVRQSWFLYDQYLYSATHRAVKNRHHSTGAFYQTRLFQTKKDAWDFYYKKNRAHIDMSKFTVVRKKVLIQKDGYLEFWKNTKSFR